MVRFLVQAKADKDLGLRDAKHKAVRAVSQDISDSVSNRLRRASRVDCRPVLASVCCCQDKAGKHGATPLSIAAKYDQLSSVQYLIEARADKDFGENRCQCFTVPSFHLTRTRLACTEPALCSSRPSMARQPEVYLYIRVCVRFGRQIIQTLTRDRLGKCG